MRVSLDTNRKIGKSRPYRTATAAVFSAALLLSNFSGASPSVTAQEDSSAEPSVSATVEEPRQESIAPVTPSPSEPSAAAETKEAAEAEAAVTPEPSETTEESTAEETPSVEAEETPTPEATPEVTEATITVRIASGLSDVKLRLHTGNANKSGQQYQSPGPAAYRMAPETVHLLCPKHMPTTMRPAKTTMHNFG